MDESIALNNILNILAETSKPFESAAIAESISVFPSGFFLMF